MLALAQGPLYTQTSSDIASSRCDNKPLELYVEDQSAKVVQYFDEDASARSSLLSRWSLDNESLSVLDTGTVLARSRRNGSQVVVKRTKKTNERDLEALHREIAVLNAVTDPSVISYHESLESNSALWAILDAPPGPSLCDYIKAQGPQPADKLKVFTTQLFSSLASIFAAGFAHLRICEETISIKNNALLVISNFENAFPYGADRMEDLYAITEEKRGSDIYVAPEVFANIRYNARKAVIWSCGVVIYFMSTGTTTPLAVLNHPSFDTASLTNTTTQSTITPLESSPPPPSPSRRKLSTSKAQSLHIPLIPYPQGRHTQPGWVRDIVSKMLQVNPLRRAELIEVAAKVPKEYSRKEARGLMEVAWGDYKAHVGPLAGLYGGGAGGDGRGDEGGSMFSFGAGSGFSGFSAFSTESFRALLPGRARRRSTVVTGKVGEAREGIGSGFGGFRRRSDWV